MLNLRVILLLEKLQRRSYYRVDRLGDMRDILGAKLALHPVRQAKSRHIGVERDGVAVEEIRNENRVSEERQQC